MKPAVYLTLVLSFGSLALATGLADPPQPTPTQLTKDPREPEPLQGNDPAPRRDLNGDLLPPGAINRIGSNRFRHGGPVVRVVYTPDGKAIASTSTDGYLRLWDAATGGLRWRIGFDKNDMTDHDALAVSADGKKVALLSTFEYTLVATDTAKKLVHHVWPRKFDDMARCSAIAPDLATLARACFDDTVRLYDAVTGQEKARIVVGENEKLEYPYAIEFSSSGGMLHVLANQKPGVLVFETNTGKAAQVLRTRDPIDSNKHHLLATMDPYEVVFWDLKAGKKRHVINDEWPKRPAGGFVPVCSLSLESRSGAFSPDCSLFAAAGDVRPDIVLFDTATGKEQRRLSVHGGTRSLAFAPGGTTLAAGDYGGCITLWDIATGKPLSPSPVPKHLGQIRFANNGREILSLGESVDWWDVASTKRIRSLPWDANWYKKAASSDGKLLAASIPQGDVLLMDAYTGKLLHTLRSEKSAMYLPSFSPDGTKLFTAYGAIIVWDLSTYKPLHELNSHDGVVDTIVVSPDGRWLASVSNGWNAQKDYDIRLWEVATGKLLHRLKPRGGVAFALAFSGDSSRLASVGGDSYGTDKSGSGEMQLWNVATGKEVRAFTGHQDRVVCVAVTPDGRMLATGSEDNTLRLWEVASGIERGRIAGHESRVFSVDFSSGGKLLAAASSDAPVYIWDTYALQEPARVGAKFTKEDQEQLWRKLANPDGAVAFQAMCTLIASPNEAMATLKEGWQRLPRPTVATNKQMRKWLEDLSSEQFAVRREATAGLERFAAEYENLLGDALKQARSLEARQRLERILGGLDPERLRQGRVLEDRMLEVLEQLRTPQARQFLQALAEQKEDAFMAREAAAGLKRLEQVK